MTASIYERVGGENAIFAAALGLYERILSDPLLAPFFAGLDVTQQVRKQVAFLSWAFGGPERYEFRALGEAHAALRTRGLTDEHFDAVAGHLVSTLQALGVEQELIAEIVTLVETTRAQVLGR